MCVEVWNASWFIKHRREDKHYACWWQRANPGGKLSAGAREWLQSFYALLPTVTLLLAKPQKLLFCARSSTVFSYFLSGSCCMFSRFAGLLHAILSECSAVFAGLHCISSANNREFYFVGFILCAQRELNFQRSKLNLPLIKVDTNFEAGIII